MKASRVATELERWSKSLDGFLTETISVSEAGDEGTENWLRAVAQQVKDAPIDHEGDLYLNVALVIGLSSRKLAISLTANHWQGALRVAKKMKSSWPEQDPICRRLPTAIDFLKLQLEQSLGNAGFLEMVTILNEENQAFAHKSALSWAMRFLILYATQCTQRNHERDQFDLAFLQLVLPAAL